MLHLGDFCKHIAANKCKLVLAYLLGAETTAFLVCRLLGRRQLAEVFRTGLAAYFYGIEMYSPGTRWSQ